MWTTRHLLLGFALAVIQASTSQLYGQNSTAPMHQDDSGKPEVEQFEVATIKPGSLDANGIRFFSLNIDPNGRVKITNWSLENLISAAYGLGQWQIKGGPKWITEDKFDIEAKPPGPGDGAPAYDVRHDNWTIDDQRLRFMLQALLKDRFQLKFHFEVKDGPVLLLERGDGELALKPSEHPSPRGLGGIGITRGVRLLNTTMPQFVENLDWVVFHETVIDKTGLTDQYDFQSKRTEPPSLGPDGAIFDSESVVSLFLPAIKEMGLKLTRSTGPVTTLVADQAAHPSPN